MSGVFAERTLFGNRVFSHSDAFFRCFFVMFYQAAVVDLPWLRPMAGAVHLHQDPSSSFVGQ